MTVSDLQIVAKMFSASVGPICCALAGLSWGLDLPSKIKFGTLDLSHCRRGTPNSAPRRPHQPPRLPHGEANGPTKPPKPLWRRFWT